MASEYQIAIKIAGELESSFNQAISEAQKGVSKLSGIGAVAGGIGSFISTGAKLATGALTAAVSGTVAMGKAALDTGMSFDTAMSQVAATMGTTVDDIGNLKAAAMDMGATTKFTATEAAEGINILAMSGMDSNAILAENAQGASLLSTTLSLASAGAMDMSNAAGYLTTAIKGFGDEASNAQYYADLMAKGATLANTDVSMLGEAMGAISANASAYHQSAESTTVQLLRLAEGGMTGTEAATALSRAMADLYTPTESAATALASLGVSAYDSQGNAKDFGAVVDELSAALSGMSEEEAAATASAIFTTNGLKAFNKITSVSDEKVQSFQEGLAGASTEFGGIGAAAGQAAVQLDNLEGDVTLLSSAYDGLKLGIYNAFSGQARSAVSQFTGYMTELSDAVSTGDLGTVGSALGNVFASFATQAMSYMPTIIHVATQMVTGLIGGIQNNLPQIASSAVNVVTTFVQGVFTIMPQLITTGVALIVQFAAGIAQQLPSLIMMGAQSAMSVYSGIVQQLPSILSAGLMLITQLAVGVVQALPMILSTGFQIIMQLLQGIIQALPTIIQVGAQIMIMFLASVIQNLPQILSGGIQIIIQLVAGIVQAIPLLFSAATEILTALCEMLLDPQTWINLGKSIVDGIKNGITGAVSSIGGILGDGIGSLFGTGIEKGEELGRGASQGVEATTSNIQNSLSGLIGDMNLDFNIDTSSVDSSAANLQGSAAGIETAMSGLTTAASGVETSLTTMDTTSSTIFSNLATTVQTTDQTVATDVNTTWTQATTDTTTQMTQMQAAVDSGGANIVSSCQSTASSIQSTFDSLNLYSAGANIMQGLLNGINSKRSALISAAQSIANSISSTINSAMQIGSPSKLMYQTGAWVGEGLALGVESQEGRVSQAANTSLAGPLAGSISGSTRAASAEGAAGGQIVYSPVINVTGSGVSAEDVRSAVSMSFEEFKRYYARLQKERSRLALA